MEEFTSRSFFGNRQIENIGWEINVRNNKSEKITLNIIDQIPISTHKDIDIRLENKSHANHEEDTGMLRWSIVLNPSESKSLKFNYNVRYPKDKRLILE